jgi:hypothetical protein
VDPLSEDDLNAVHDPLMSPLVWDLGHIAAFEDLWLCEHEDGLRPLRPELAAVYDATEANSDANPQAARQRKAARLQGFPIAGAGYEHLSPTAYRFVEVRRLA